MCSSCLQRSHKNLKALGHCVQKGDHVLFYELTTITAALSDSLCELMP